MLKYLGFMLIVVGLAFAGWAAWNHFANCWVYPYEQAPVLFCWSLLIGSIVLALVLVGVGGFLVSLAPQQRSLSQTPKN